MTAALDYSWGLKPDPFRQNRAPELPLNTITRLLGRADYVSPPATAFHAWFTALDSTDSLGLVHRVPELLSDHSSPPALPGDTI